MDARFANLWEWFSANGWRFAAGPRFDEAAFDEWIAALHAVDPGLFAELCVDSTPKELVLTAQGRIELFDLVDRIVAAAPPLDGWVVHALKPPMGFAFRTAYEGVEVRPKTLWFLPLESASRPGQLGLRIGVPDLDEARRREVANAVLVALDTALGERRMALEVQHVEVAALPPDPDRDGWLALADLPGFLDARRDAGA